MLIGEIARRAGVSRDTVRLYTRLGLLPCQEVTAGSRTYADYDEDATQLIRDIQIAKSLGFSLAEIRPIAQLYLSGNLDPGQTTRRASSQAWRRPTHAAAPGRHGTSLETKLTALQND